MPPRAGVLLPAFHPHSESPQQQLHEKDKACQSVWFSLLHSYRYREMKRFTRCVVLVSFMLQKGRPGVTPV